jgi:ABC-type bacteriocin/lantibiotic exporter with double-glycine peptidase domain
MHTLEVVTVFFGWMTAINFVFLFVASIMVMTMRGAMSRVYSRMFGVEAADLPRVYFQCLGQYEIAIIVFSLTPYIALRIMS